MLEQSIQNGRARPTNLPASFTRPVQQLQPVRLNLKKSLVAREFVRRGGVGRKRQPRGGGGFNLFEQVLHGRIGWMGLTVKKSETLWRARRSIDLRDHAGPLRP